MTTKDLFVSEISRLWETLKKRDDTIFENITIQLDAEQKFEELRENQNMHLALVSESSEYNKKRMIQAYFWENIVGDLYEHTLDIMKKAGLLEEALDSFEKSYKIETTARLILENGVFANFPADKKKELTESTIEVCFYPATIQDRNESLLQDVLEESMISNRIDRMGQFLGNMVRGTGRLFKNLYLALMIGLISPAVSLGAIASRAGDFVKEKAGYQPTGMNPNLRKFYETLDAFISPVNWIYRFLNQDLIDVSEWLKKANNLEDDTIRDVLREMKADPNKIIRKCWDRNKFQMPRSDKDSINLTDRVIHLLGGKGIANFIRDPMYNSETQIARIIKSDAADPHYQKMFFDFRVCVYDKIFEIILGYAKAIYSMDDASYEVIKAANEAHQRKNFKAFFELKPKQANEEAMFKIMRALVAIDSLTYALEKRKGELVADKYIDKFIDYLKQNIKQTYQELNEMANQYKYNADRYKEVQPTDEEKAEAIQKERFNAKKSIFEI